MKEKNPNGLGSLTYRVVNGKKYWTGRVTLGQDLEGKLVRKSFSSYKKYEVIEKMQKALGQTNIAGFTTSGDKSLSEFMSYWLYNIKVKEIRFYNKCWGPPRLQHLFFAIKNALISFFLYNKVTTTK